MADIGQATTLQLSASELQNLTKWPDSVIIQFLSNQESISQISQTISIVVNNIDQAITQIAQTETSVQLLRQESVIQQQQIAALDSLPGLINTLRQSFTSLLDAQSQYLESLQTQIAMQNSKLQQQAESIADLDQLIHS